jgi:tetratricopeptide (TPR) repeat protein
VRATNHSATELLRLAAATAEPVHRRNGLTLQGMAAMADRRYPAAVRAFEEALHAAERAGTGWLLATSVLNLGVAALHAGDVERGERLIDDAVRRYRAHGDELFEARATRYLAVCALVRGDEPSAVQLFRHCLDRACQLGEKWGVAESLEGMALISAATGRPERAGQFIGAAEALRKDLGARQHPFDRELFERHLERTSIPPAAWQSSREAGRAMSLAEAMTLARW